MIVNNQLHNPRPKKHCIDKLGNDRNRLWLKSGNCTMLLTQGITKSAAKVLEMKVRSFTQALGLKIEPTFLITK